tara:strand:+ start:1379 stop:1801 length:423 start_codon:yes stop_codon:yes gene_type:complete
MNRIFFLLFLIVAGCSSKTPVDMEDVLYDRSGQYITDDNYDPSFLGFIYNQKVYNGPGYLRYRSGEKREQGTLKNGYKSGAWTGYDKKGNKKFIGEYEQGKAHGKWAGFTPTEIKSMKEYMRLVFKQESGLILIQQERKI